MITDGGGSAKAIGELHIAPGVECVVEGRLAAYDAGVGPAVCAENLSFPKIPSGED